MAYMERLADYLIYAIEFLDNCLDTIPYLDDIELDILDHDWAIIDSIDL